MLTVIIQTQAAKIKLKKNISDLFVSFLKVIFRNELAVQLQVEDEPAVVVAVKRYGQVVKMSP
jgi:hypothetical protein